MVVVGRDVQYKDQDDLGRAGLTYKKVGKLLSVSIQWGFGNASLVLPNALTRATTSTYSNAHLGMQNGRESRSQYYETAAAAKTTTRDYPFPSQKQTKHTKGSGLLLFPLLYLPEPFHTNHFSCKTHNNKTAAETLNGKKDSTCHTFTILALLFGIEIEDDNPTLAIAQCCILCQLTTFRITNDFVKIIRKNFALW